MNYVKQQTLYDERLCTVQAIIASLPSGAVTFSMGALKPGSAAKKKQFRTKKK